MNKAKKILSSFLLVFLIVNLFWNVSAEWETWTETETEVEVKEKKKIIVYDLKNWPFKHKLEKIIKKIYHKPSWMYVKNKDFFCEKGESYFVVTKEWKKVWQLSLNCDVEFDDKEKNTKFAEEILKWTDAILWDGETKELNTSEEVKEEWKDEEEVDDFIENLLWTKVKLINVSINNEKLFLSWNKMATSIKAYSLNKEELEISKFKIEGLKNKDYYNWIVANLFSKFERKAKLNSSKIELSKSISKISFSFSSYVNEDLDDNIREIFRKKLVSDLKELQTSYSKLKNEDKKVSNFLLNRG